MLPTNDNVTKNPSQSKILNFLHLNIDVTFSVTNRNISKFLFIESKFRSLLSNYADVDRKK